jgi:predicted membrane metal-binding protein
MSNGHIQSSDSKPGRVRFFSTRNLSVLVTGAIVVVGEVKADPKDIPKIFDSLFASHLWAALGWALAIILLICSIILIRIIMMIDGKEIDRLAKERDELQKKLLAK